MSDRFDDVLNDCLEKMSEGKSIEECIEAHPQYREDLLPLLNTAQTTILAVSSISYRIEARQRGMDLMMQAYTEGRMNARRPWYSVPFLRPLARPILVGFVAVFLTAVAAGGSTMAADSVPGEPLYWVKKTRENVSLMMPQSNMEKAETHARLASTRAQEIDRLIERNRIRDAELMIRRIEHHLNKTASYAGVVLIGNRLEMPAPRSRNNITQLRQDLERDVRLMRVRLEHRADSVPNVNRVKIIRIMRQSDLDYRIVIQAMNQPSSLNDGFFWRNQPTFTSAR